MRTVLAADIGNTTTAFAVFVGDDMAHRFAMTTRDRTVDEYVLAVDGMLSRQGVRPDGAVVGSVVPSTVSALHRALEHMVQGRIVRVGPGTRSGLADPSGPKTPSFLTRTTLDFAISSSRHR